MFQAALEQLTKVMLVETHFLLTMEEVAAVVLVQ
jgi:hypothetical protein